MIHVRGLVIFSLVSGVNGGPCLALPTRVQAPRPARMARPPSALCICDRRPAAQHLQRQRRWQHLLPPLLPPLAALRQACACFLFHLPRHPHRQQRHRRHRHRPAVRLLLFHRQGCQIHPWPTTRTPLRQCPTYSRGALQSSESLVRSLMARNIKCTHCANIYMAAYTVKAHPQTHVP